MNLSNHKLPLAFVALLSSLVVLTSCGRSNPLGRSPVEGKVTLDGQVVLLGAIQFEPLARNGVGSGAKIVDGRYAMALQDGLPPGRYRIRIFYPQPDVTAALANRPPGPPGEHLPDGFAPAQELVPAEYNTQSVQEVEVTTGGPQRFDFDIET